MKRTLLFAALFAISPAFASEIDPFGFDKQVFVSTKTRTDVRAELTAAQFAGELPVGEVGARFADVPSVKTRAQVVAETREAARLGLLRNREIGRLPTTFAEQQLIRQAGLRAIGVTQITK